MAKKNSADTECIKFKGVPVTGDIKTFLRILEKQCGFEHEDIEETSVPISGTFVGMSTSSDVKFSIASKTVYDLGIELMEGDGGNYEYFKSLYTEKYGEPTNTVRNGDEADSYDAPGGRIDVIRQCWGVEIRYVNTVNEQLAMREQRNALLDEI